MRTGRFFPSCARFLPYHFGVLTLLALDYVIAVSEPGLQIECDGCACDLTHSIRIKCADPACEVGDGVDICPACFCSGKEFGTHKRGHAYRVVVSGSDG